MHNNTKDTLYDNTNDNTIELDPSSRTGRWAIAGLIIMSVGLIMLFTGQPMGNVSHDYKLRRDTEYSLVEVTAIDADSADNLYVLSDCLSAVNVYSADGVFQYSLKAPDYPNGSSAINITADTLYFEDRNDTRYVYKSGVYQGKAETVYGDGDSMSIWVYDQNDNLAYTLPFIEGEHSHSLMFMDGDTVTIGDRSDSPGLTLLTYENGVLVSSEPVDAYADEYYFASSTATDSQGNTYRVSSYGPQLIKTTPGGEETVIASTSWLEWIWRTSIISFVITAVGILTALVSRLIPQKTKKRQKPSQ